MQSQLSCPDLERIVSKENDCLLEPFCFGWFITLQKLTEIIELEIVQKEEELSKAMHV